MTESSANLDSHLRVIRIIAGALIAGVLLFAGIVLLLVHGSGEPVQPRGQLISLIMAGLVAVELVPFALVATMIRVDSPAIQQSLQRQRATSPPVDPDQLHLAVYQIRMIIRYAILEGGAFANLVAYMLERNWWSLAIVGGLVFLMLTMFPTRTRLEHWLETQRMLDI